MTYKYRKSAFVKKHAYVLENNTITVFNDNNMRVNTVNLDDISQISLVHTPTKGARKMHQCTIKIKSNEKIILRNYSYLGLANFKHQRDAYLAFVLELHTKTKDKNIQFKKGINKNGFSFLMLFMVLMTGLMVVITIALFNKGKYGEMVVSGLAVLLFVFIIITSNARFKPENYNPNAIPKQLLPN